MNKPLVYQALILAICMSIGGCSGEQKKQSPEDILQDIKKKSASASKKEPLKIPKLPEKIQYQERRVLTPFRESSQVQQRSSSDRVAPLQGYPLNMLTLVGTITDGDRVYAYVATPDHMIHRVDVNDILGDKKGRVAKIENDRIEVDVVEEIEKQQPKRSIFVLELKDEP